MDTIRSWIFGEKNRVPVIGEGNQTDAQNISLLKTGEDDQEITSRPESAQREEKHDHHITTIIDPKVAEYFKDFPEPYKTKAITRFSSREGLYKWDLYRDFVMMREYQSAANGVFLEDKRDSWKRFNQREQFYEESAKSEKKEDDDTREMSALEEAIRKVIPVHDEESLALKLFQTANFSVLGFAILWSAVTVKKRKPSLPNWQHYMALAGSTYVCAYLQAAAVYRAMDWGPFDRSVDNRSALTKEMEDVKNFFSSLFTKNISNTNTDRRNES